MIKQEKKECREHLKHLRTQVGQMLYQTRCQNGWTLGDIYAIFGISPRWLEQVEFGKVDLRLGELNYLLYSIGKELNLSWSDIKKED